MGRLVRFIFRFDYDICYEFLNKPGDALEVVQKISANYWDIAGEAVDRRLISARKKYSIENCQVAEEVSFEPTAFSGSFECSTGLPIKGAQFSKYLELASKISAASLNKFNLYKLNRIGARFIVIGDEVKSFDESRQLFDERSKLSGVLSLDGKIGKVTDSAVILHGIVAGDLSFRLHTGPGAKTDWAYALSKVRVSDADIERLAPHSYLMDLDLFELNIDFKTATLQKWLADKWKVLEAFEDSIRRLVTK